MRTIIIVFFSLCFLYIKAQNNNPPIRSYDTAQVVGYYTWGWYSPYSRIYKRLTVPYYSDKMPFESNLDYYHNIKLVLFSDGVYKCYHEHRETNDAEIEGNYEWKDNSLVLHMPNFGRVKHAEGEKYLLFSISDDRADGCTYPFRFDELVFSGNRLSYFYQPATRDSFYIDLFLSQQEDTLNNKTTIKCFREDKIIFEKTAPFRDSVWRVAFSKAVQIDSFHISTFATSSQEAFKNTNFTFPQDSKKYSIFVFLLYSGTMTYANDMKWNALTKSGEKEFIKTYGLPTFEGDFYYRDWCYLPHPWVWPIKQEKVFYPLLGNKKALISTHWKGFLDFGAILVKRPIPKRTGERRHDYIFEHPIKTFLEKNTK